MKPLTFGRIKALLARWFGWFKSKPARAPAEPAPTPAPQPTTYEFGNRAERRALERARRRYDKLVKAGGPKAKGNGHVSSIKKPVVEIIPPSPLEDEELIVGKHADAPEEDPPDILYEGSEFSGEFNFRDTILDQLDRYFFYLRRMRKFDPDSYEFYRQIGANIVPYSTLAHHHKSEEDEEDQNWKFSPEQIERMRRYKLSSFFVQQKPAFGCVAYGADLHSPYRSCITMHRKTSLA